MHRHITTLALLSALALPAAAAASPGDRDHDGMPDRWERRHHVRVPHADPDRDKLPNLAEFRRHTNPRNSDSDGDGVRDGAESVGTVKSLNRGILTISLAAGGELSGRIDRRTKVFCVRVAVPLAREASRGPGRPGGAGAVARPRPVTADGGDEAPAPDAGYGDAEERDADAMPYDAGDEGDDRDADETDDEPVEDEGDEDVEDEEADADDEGAAPRRRARRCGFAALSAGTVVKEALLHADPRGLKFDRIELLK